MLSPKIWTMTTMSALTTSIQHCTKGSIQARRGRGTKVGKKRNTRYTDWKNRGKTNPIHRGHDLV